MAGDELLSPLSFLGYINAWVHRLLPRRIADLRVRISLDDSERLQRYYEVLSAIEALPPLSEVTPVTLAPVLELIDELGLDPGDYFESLPLDLKDAYLPQLELLPSLEEIGRGGVYNELVELDFVLRLIDYIEAKTLYTEAMAAGFTHEDALARVTRWSHKLGRLYAQRLFG